jgi:hypothetical protein
MINIQRILPGFFLLLVFVSCNSKGKESCRSYYFPVQNFMQEKIYVFVNESNTEDTVFWAMKTTLAGSDTIFNTRIYNSKTNLEKITERYENGTAFMREYSVYRDGVEIPCRVEDSTVYACNQQENNTVSWSFWYINNEQKFRLKKKRNQIKRDENQEVFLDKMQMNIEGKEEAYDYTVRITYEFNKGIISYTIKSPAIKATYNLKKVI